MTSRELGNRNLAAPIEGGDLTDLFRERQALVHAAGATKTDPAQVPAPARVEAVIANVRDAATTLGLDEEAIEGAYRTIVALFIAHEAALMAVRMEREESRAEPRPGASLAEVRKRVDELDRLTVRAAAKVGGRDGAVASLLGAARLVLTS